MLFISQIIYLIMIMLSVAYFTLFERKVLGYVHIRLGPNKNILIGLGQPFNDLIKLFSKLDNKFLFMSLFIYMIVPLIMVMISLLNCMLIFEWGKSSNMLYFFLVYLCLNGIISIFFLFPGWVSGSIYSTLGSYRVSAQVISYEGVFFFCIMAFCMFCSNYTMYMMNYSSNFFFLMLNIFFLIPIWMIVILAEANRSPFDFAEGESELVSGFNTEYGGGFFSLIFLSEYMSVLFLSYMSSMFLCGASFLKILLFLFFLFFFVWVRVSFPRMRYDKLMLMSWKSMMFLITSLFIMYVYMILY